MRWGKRIKVCGLRLQAVARRLRRLFLGAGRSGVVKIRVHCSAERPASWRPTNCVELQNICHLAAGTPEPAAARPRRSSLFGSRKAAWLLPVSSFMAAIAESS